MSISTRVAIAATTVAVLSPLLVGSPAAAAEPTTDSEHGARWLAAQIDETTGLIATRYGEVPTPRPEYEVAVDAIIALDRVGTEPEAVAQLLGAVEAGVTTFATPETPDRYYADRLGKLVVAVILADGDATSFGGRDLAGDLSASLDETGRPRIGVSEPGGVRGQAWVIRALAMTGDLDGVSAATDALLQMQCADGSFPEFEGETECVASIAGTAHASIALGVARDAVGSQAAGAALEQAADALGRAQGSTGAFGNELEVSPENTGLAADALTASGRPIDDVRATRAAGWIREVQVDAASAKGSLASERGAILPSRASMGGLNPFGRLVHAASVYGTAVALPALALVDGTIEFSDVPAGLHFFPEIGWLSGTGITTGYPEADGSTTFRPAAPVLREQMAAFLFRFAGSPADYTAPADSPFRDVPTTHRFYREITWLAEQEITTGYEETDGSTTFRPAAPVLREQMAAFLYRTAGETVVDDDGATFTDVAVGFTFYDAIEWLAGTGITTGYAEPNGTSTFRGAQPVLREQMAAFLFRFDQLGND